MAGLHLHLVPDEPAGATDHMAPKSGARPDGGGVLSLTERRLLTRVAEVLLPAGQVFPGAGAGTVDRVDVFLSTLPVQVAAGYRATLRLLSASAWLRHRRPIDGLSPAELLGVCQALYRGGFTSRTLLRTLVTPLKVAHFDDPAMFSRIGSPYGARGGRSELPRYVRERTLRAADVPDGEVLECDAVVVGSGAGGAVAARELAEAGHAVLLLEEGEYYTRADFTGHVVEMQRKMYRDMGGTIAWGNTAIPVPIGRAVGGTTVINSGTCYRMPGRVLRKWRDLCGLSMFTDEEMEPHYERVERVLRVEKARAEVIGGMGSIIARGCEALGYRHGPLSRNAPECDGQGVCCFGCPTDAKRSTNVSYVPLALRAGAQLLTGARVESLIIEGGRAVGVRVAARDETGKARGFTVRSQAVVLAAGALMTPVLLLSDTVARAALSRSGQLGRNLSIHPAAAVFALMPNEKVRGYAAIPQGYAIEEFHEEGLLMEGAFAPLDLGAASLTLVGPRFMELMDAYERMACFGFMVEDESRGRVRPGPHGRPLITYSLLDHDVARIKRGVEILMRIYLHAGAEAIIPQVQGFEEVRGEEDLRRFRQAQLRARDFDLTAYHPLGTTRMGVDPRASIVDPDQQAHDLPGLYICDGSVLPTSPAVNPQITIMALCTRAARKLADRLS